MTEPQALKLESLMISLFEKTKPSIDERFEKWINENPQVMAMFQKFTYQLWENGRRRYSASAICERVRWEMDLNASRENGFSINDHFTSRLARRAMELDPKLHGFFETRTIRTA